jgi:PilZ domain
MNSLLNGPGRGEYRAKPRTRRPFPVTVSGTDQRGEVFEADTLIENLSASGAYLFLDRSLEEGAELTLEVQFSLAQGSEDATARLEAQGVIRRVGTKIGGRYGIAVEFRQYRFLCLQWAKGLAQFG